MIKLTFEFATINEMREFLDKRVPQETVLVVREASTATAPVAATADGTIIEPAPKKRGRPTKEHAPAAPAPRVTDSDREAVATQQEAATQPAAPAEPAPVDKGDAVPPLDAAAPTTDDAKAALEAVFNAKGFQGAQQLVSTFGVSKLRDLPVETYAAFIEKAKELAA